MSVLLLTILFTGVSVISATEETSNLIGTVRASSPPPASIVEENQNLTSKSCLEAGEEYTCYYDYQGRVVYWIAKDFTVRYAEIRDRQKLYNAWVEANRSSRSRMEPDIRLERYPQWPKGWLVFEEYFQFSMPAKVREDGRLNRRTLQIPFYRKARSMLVLWQGFQRDCKIAASRKSADFFVCQMSLKGYSLRAEFPNLAQRVRFPSSTLKDRADELLSAKKGSDDFWDLVYKLPAKHGDNVLTPEEYADVDLLEPNDTPKGMPTKLREIQAKIETALTNARYLEETYRSTDWVE